MIQKEEVYRIGTFTKPHGVKGELQFSFTDDIFDRIDADYIICEMDGILVPFFIEEYRFCSDTSVLMKLEDIDTVEDARQFTNASVYFPIKLRDSSEDIDLTWDTFIGYTITDKRAGFLGEITDVDNSTINTLFILDFQGKELLIPAQEDFILELSHEHKSILMNLPDGLINIDDSIDGDNANE